MERYNERKGGIRNGRRQLTAQLREVKVLTEHTSE